MKIWNRAVTYAGWAVVSMVRISPGEPQLLARLTYGGGGGGLDECLAAPYPTNCDLYPTLCGLAGVRALRRRRKP